MAVLLNGLAVGQQCPAICYELSGGTSLEPDDDTVDQDINPADSCGGVYARFRSRQKDTFGEKMLSAMRFGFGGHVEGQEPIDPQTKPNVPGGDLAIKHAAE